MTAPRIDLPITSDDKPYVSQFYARYDANKSDKYPDLTPQIVIISEHVTFCQEDSGIERIDIQTQAQAKALIAFIQAHMSTLPLE